MTRARDLILSRGGAAQANVFTRIALALFGQVPWRAVPEMPVEIMLLPRWFPFLGFAGAGFAGRSATGRHASPHPWYEFVG